MLNAPKYTKAQLGQVFLPVGPMLQIDHVDRVEGETIVCTQNLEDSNWLFQVHFPGDPIFPGSLMIEGAGQVVAIWMWDSGMRGKPRLIKVESEFKSPLVPSDGHVTYTAKVQRRSKVCVGQVDLTVGDRLVAKVGIWLAVVS